VATSAFRIDWHLPTKKYPDPIIIAKFNSQKLRDSIYSKRIKLKNVDRTMSGGSKLYIKSLTKTNKQIFRAALSFKMKYNYKYIWTRHGLTYLRKTDDSQAKIMRRVEDILAEAEKRS